MNQSQNIDRVVFDEPSESTEESIGQSAGNKLSRYRFNVVWDIQFILREHVKEVCENT